jgi:hypothetical protein
LTTIFFFRSLFCAVFYWIWFSQIATLLTFLPS